MVRARLSTGADRQSLGEPSRAAPLTPAPNWTRVLRAQRLMATKKEKPRTDIAGCNEKGLWRGAFIGNRTCILPGITSLSRTEEGCLLFINKWFVQGGELGAGGAGCTPVPAQAWVRLAKSGRRLLCSSPRAAEDKVAPPELASICPGERLPSGICSCRTLSVL